MTNLTDKQKLFIKEYLIDLNATQAAIRAGYSENCAAEQGWENLRKPEIKEAIDKAIEKRHKRIEITAEEVLEGIKETIELAKGLKQTASAMKGFELLGKHIAMFTDVKKTDSTVHVQFDDPEEKEV